MGQVEGCVELGRRERYPLVPGKELTKSALALMCCQCTCLDNLIGFLPPQSFLNQWIGSPNAILAPTPPQSNPQEPSRETPAGLTRDAGDGDDERRLYPAPPPFGLTYIGWRVKCRWPRGCCCTQALGAPAPRAHNPAIPPFLPPRRCRLALVPRSVTPCRTPVRRCWAPGEMTSPSAN